jgi:flagellar basal body-associated protein FliL
MSDTATKKSNKTMWIIIGFVALVIIAACVYFFWYKPKQEEEAAAAGGTGTGTGTDPKKTVNPTDPVLIKTLAAESNPQVIARILQAA